MWRSAPADRPLPLWSPVLVYDRRGDRALLFGGDHQNDGELTDEGWEYDLTPARGGWRELTPMPDRLIYQAGTATDDAVIVFGGQDERGEEKSVLWRFDPAADGGRGRWHDLSTSIEGPSPPARVGASLVYDEAGRQAFLFAGYAAGGDLGDLWRLDLATPAAPSWHRLAPEGPSPVGRSAHSAVWDAPRKRMLIYGGVQGEGGGVRFRDDAWAYYPGGAAIPTATPTHEATSTEASTATPTVNPTSTDPPASTHTPDAESFVIVLPVVRRDA
jgi:hypothetical protein